MRHRGRVRTWKDDKGFGFVVPNDGGSDVFLHISAFTRRRKRPEVGDLVTYELSTDERGRPKATKVLFADDQGLTGTNKPSAFLSLLGATLVLVFVLYVAHVHHSHPNSTVPASVYKVFFARSALHNEGQFQCAPKKTSCSQMSSCSEAFFHQERCGATEMDGDGDGIPCERQWCN